jgi:outer membrane receptor for monomeric catechols
MPSNLLRTMLVVAACLCQAAFAAASERPRHAPAKHHVTRTQAAGGGASVDPAAPYKADRLYWSRTGRVLDTPGQTTVLTRQVLDDMNATTLRDALRSTAGVTVGR